MFWVEALVETGISVAVDCCKTGALSVIDGSGIVCSACVSSTGSMRKMFILYVGSFVDDSCSVESRWFVGSTLAVAGVT